MVIFYENNIKFPLTKEIVKDFQPFIWNLTETLALALAILKIFTFSLNSHIQYYPCYLCYLVRDLRKLFQQGFPSIRFSLSTLTKIIITSFRYLFSNDWKQISITIRLLQNLLITDNAWVFLKVYFWSVSLLI